ncbi:MAG: error-prone DNA polymerase [Candidatus Zixiibacteriota bacterium]
MAYIELHCHSNFSFLDGASHPEELAERAAALGYPALALTDHSGLYGIIRFAQACRQHGVKPIVGAEITLEDGFHLTLLARDARGYRNLSSLLSASLATCAKGECKVSYALLEAHAKRLVAFSGCDQSEIASLLLADNYSAARTRAAHLRELFGRDNFYLELIHHRLPTHEKTVEALSRLGTDLGIPCVATNNVHYATKADRKIQDVLTCIRTHSRLDEAEGILYPNGERYLKSERQMRRLFARYPSAVENSLRVGDECEFSLDYLMTMLPDFPVPEDHTVHTYLRELSYIGARDRYGELTEAVVAQLEHELDLIIRLNLSGYFLIVWDIVRFCREQGILCQGRGSAANSAVCYSLAITSVDPIRLKLLFERFLSEGRKEPPDIDIDIAHARREEVIQYVYNKYGRDHAGMVANVICYRARSAVRDIGKTLGFTIEDCNRLSKLLDHYRGGEDLGVRLKEAGFDITSKRITLLMELVARIRTFPRHLGIHVGGMVITQSPLTDIVPIENATMPNRTVVQWDKDDCADARLVKIDLLGLGELTCIDLAFRLIKQHAGISLDMAKLTYDDPKVFDYICKAETVGVFQIESRAQMSTLPRMKPRTFYDIVVEVAIIRPGPIQGDMVHPYLRRRNGEEEVTYPHPKLIPVLERTLGVPLFQEQGMQLVMLAAGFSASDADELRRAMGHKRSHERMAALYDRIVTGMVANGYTEEVAIKIFKQLAAFADFGFAESHAASFALLVYVSAWLKLYYPTEFYCALLNAQPMGFYSPSSIIFEGKRRGIRFLPVDITSSEWDCTMEGAAVRVGFRFVGSLGDTAKEKIKTALASGRFSSVADFVFRTGLTEDAVRQIAKVGAFNKVGRSRRDSLWDVLAVSREDPDAPSLFPEEAGAVPFPAMTKKEKLSTDFGVMGLTTGPHPMTLIRPMLVKQNVLSSADIRRVSNGTPVKVAGMVIIRQQPETAKGIIFATLEDEFGFINIVVKPTYKKKYRDAFLYSTCLLVKGQLERKGSVINIVGLEFSPLNFEETKIAMKSRNFH